jgi:hypothetical protein
MSYDEEAIYRKASLWSDAYVEVITWQKKWNSKQ